MLTVSTILYNNNNKFVTLMVPLIVFIDYYILDVSFFLQTWNNFASYYNQNSSDPSLLEDSTYLFDAIWTAALALNNTASKLPNGITLKNFTYENSNMSQLIYEETLKVNFFGLTVSILSLNFLFNEYNDISIIA